MMVVEHNKYTYFIPYVVIAEKHIPSKDLQERIKASAKEFVSNI